MFTMGFYMILCDFLSFFGIINQDLLVNLPIMDGSCLVVTHLETVRPEVRLEKPKSLARSRKRKAQGARKKRWQVNAILGGSFH